MDALPITFWFCLAALAYAFMGYPVLMGLLAKHLGRPARKAVPAEWPAVSVVLVAHNEADRIRARVGNLLAANYPADRLDIVVVTDGSTDGTPAAVKALGHARVRLVERTERRGKSACVNAGLAAATGEIVVLCDARQRFEPRTIPELVANFADERTGAVSGELLIESSRSSVGGGVDLYWRLEKFIRRAEARFSSVIGATGAVYAVRRALFEPVPEDTLLDDVVIPMRIALRGYRVGFDPAAPAHDPQTTDPARERRRKLRTLAGNWQLLFRYPGWLLPWRTRLWWQLASHKYARLAAPPLLVALFVTNVLLRAAPVYRELLVAHAAFYALAALGMALPGVKLRLFSVPAGFVFLNLMTVGGLWNYLRGAYRQGKW